MFDLATNITKWASNDNGPYIHSMQNEVFKDSSG